MMGIQDRDWYKEERRKQQRAQQDQQWQQLQRSGEKRRKWNRTMPRPGEIRHRSQVPENWPGSDSTPSWQTLFYWSAALNVVMLAIVFYVMR